MLSSDECHGVLLNHDGVPGMDGRVDRPISISPNPTHYIESPKAVKFLSFSRHFLMYGKSHEEPHM